MIVLSWLVSVSHVKLDRAASYISDHIFTAVEVASCFKEAKYKNNNWEEIYLL